VSAVGGHNILRRLAIYFDSESVAAIASNRAGLLWMLWYPVVTNVFRLWIN
jgi:hypothetical protein